MDWKRRWIGGRKVDWRKGWIGERGGLERGGLELGVDWRGGWIGGGMDWMGGCIGGSGLKDGKKRGGWWVG